MVKLRVIQGGRSDGDPVPLYGWPPGPPKGTEFHYNLAMEREAEALGSIARECAKQWRAEREAKAAALDPDQDAPPPRE